MMTKPQPISEGWAKLLAIDDESPPLPEIGVADERSRAWHAWLDRRSAAVQALNHYTDTTFAVIALRYGVRMIEVGVEGQGRKLPGGDLYAYFTEEQAALDCYKEIAAAVLQLSSTLVAHNFYGYYAEPSLRSHALADSAMEGAGYAINQQLSLEHHGRD